MLVTHRVFIVLISSKTTHRRLGVKMVVLFCSWTIFHSKGLVFLLLFLWKHWKYFHSCRALKLHLSYTFSHNFLPYQHSISYQRSLHIDFKIAFRWFSNYVFVFAVWTRFCSLAAESSHFPQLIQLSATVFVKLYVAGVTRQNKPHGQVRNDLDMDQVLLVQPNSSREAMVNGGQTVVLCKSPTTARLCFPAREGFWRMHGRS